MTWPGWGNILPSVTLLATSTALLWAVVRLLVRPVAERAASEAEKRSAASTRLAVDGLYDRLKGNDFRHVEDGLKGLGDRIDEARKDFGPTPQGGGNATGGTARPSAPRPEGHGGAADGRDRGEAPRRPVTRGSPYPTRSSWRRRPPGAAVSPRV